MSSIRRILFAVTACLIAFGGTAAAAPPASTPPSAAPPAAASPAASATAQELARVLVPKESWSQAMQQLSTVVQSSLEGHPGSKLQYPEDFPARIRTEVEAVLPYEDLVSMQAKELSANFTEAEMKELIADFSSATGKKWVQLQQKVTNGVNSATQRRLEEKMPEVMRKLSKFAKGPAPGKEGALPSGHPPMGSGHPPIGGEPAKKDAAPAKKQQPAKKPAPAKKPDAAPADAAKQPAPPTTEPSK